MSSVNIQFFAQCSRKSTGFDVVDLKPFPILLNSFGWGFSIFFINDDDGVAVFVNKLPFFEVGVSAAPNWFDW